MSNKSKYDQKAHSGRGYSKPSKSKKWKRPIQPFGETMDDEYDRWLEAEKAKDRRSLK